MQTPAPTKRFLPASSSRSSSSAVGTVRRNPFQPSRSTAQAPFSTPSSAATPRFQRPVTQKDEIDVSFDDETELPVLPRSRVATGTDDVAEAEDDELGVASPLLQRTKRFRPATKKRKVSQVASKNVESITISSSPGYDDFGDPEDHDLHDEVSSLASRSDMEEDDLGELPQFADTEKSSKPALFKAVKQSPSEPVSLSRTIFKANLNEGPSASAGMGPVLPDIFSPSRRKGKRDFVPGGSAELVRQWILSVAAHGPDTQTLLEDIVSRAERTS